MPLGMGTFELTLIQENKGLESNLCSDYALQGGKGRKLSKRHMSVRARREPQMKGEDREREAGRSELRGLTQHFMSSV